MKSQVWWYTARAGGTVAWALSAVSVVWGLLLSSRVLGKRISGPKLLDLHRFLGGLAVVFTAVHIAGLFFDSYVHFGPRELFVPFASDWQPNAVAWGVVAFYLLIAVEVTSLMRRRVGESVWRSVHYLGFVVFVLGTIHGLKAGTDVSNPALWWPAAGVSAAIIGLCVARVSANGDPVPGSGSPLMDESQSATQHTAATATQHTAEPATQRTAEPATQRTAEPATQRTAERIVEPTTQVPVVPEPRVEVSRRLQVDVLERTLEGLLNLDAPPAAPTPPRARRTSQEISPWSSPVVESHPVHAAPLPARTPERFAPTTEAAARIDSWRPAAAPLVGSGAGAAAARPTGPPPPPTGVDPVTGEPDPQAYRKWLKEWLAYVESQG